MGHRIHKISIRDITTPELEMGSAPMSKLKMVVSLSGSEGLVSFVIFYFRQNT